MKVVAINGSPKKEGNTYHALLGVGKQLQANNIDFEIIHVGNKAVRVVRYCVELAASTLHKHDFGTNAHRADPIAAVRARIFHRDIGRCYGRIVAGGDRKLAAVAQRNRKYAGPAQPLLIKDAGG